MSQSNSFLTSLLTALDDMMNTDDSDALFVSGYLRGHITLIAGQLEFNNSFTKEALIKQVDLALVEARQNAELTPQDAELVSACWNNFLTA